MTKRAVGLMTAAALWAAAHATPGASAAELDRNCLWRVRSETATMYLLGSVHLLKPDAYPLAPVIESAFDGSGTVVADLDSATCAR